LFKFPIKTDPNSETEPRSHEKHITNVKKQKKYFFLELLVNEKYSIENGISIVWKVTRNKL